MLQSQLCGAQGSAVLLLLLMLLQQHDLPRHHCLFRLAGCDMGQGYCCCGCCQQVGCALLNWWEGEACVAVADWQQGPLQRLEGLEKSMVQSGSPQVALGLHGASARLTWSCSCCRC